MRRLFIHARSKIAVTLPKKLVDMLGGKGKVAIVSTIQYLHSQKDIARTLKGAVAAGPVLGCSMVRSRGVDCFLYVGSGLFHPINIRMTTGKDVFTYDPETRQSGKVSDADVERIVKKKRGAMIRFLSSERIGILVSLKEGQDRMKEAQALRKSLSDEGKHPYIFVFSTLDPAGLEAFPYIEVFVNTACPRIAEDDLPRPAVNIDDIRSISL